MHYTHPALRIMILKHEKENPMDKAEEFLNLYKELEAAAAEEYGLKSNGSVVYTLSGMKEFKSIRSELDFCRDVRNLLSHRPKIDSSYAVEPSEEMIELLKKCINFVKNPKRSRNIMTKLEDVYCCTFKDDVPTALRAMSKCGFSFIPIVEDNILAGVLSEGAAVRYILNTPDVKVPEKFTFESIKEFVSIEALDPAEFVFVSEKKKVSDISSMFDEALTVKKRIKMVFVTETGLKSEPLEGIITAWDLAACM